MKTFLLMPLAFAALFGTAFAEPMVKSVKSDKGDVLAAQNGMTLYTYTKDEAGMSTCYDKCEANWPPYFATQNDKPGAGYTMVKRKDGKMQWARNGMPLYFWVKDAKQGDTTGDGVGGVWNVAKP